MTSIKADKTVKEEPGVNLGSVTQAELLKLKQSDMNGSGIDTFGACKKVEKTPPAMKRKIHVRAQTLEFNSTGTTKAGGGRRRFTEHGFKLTIPILRTRQKLYL